MIHYIYIYILQIKLLRNDKILTCLSKYPTQVRCQFTL
jgi:hypothetical protein